MSPGRTGCRSGAPEQGKAPISYCWWSFRVVVVLAVLWAMFPWVPHRAASALGPLALGGDVPLPVARGVATLVGPHDGIDRLSLTIGLALPDSALHEASALRQVSTGRPLTQAQANVVMNPKLSQELQVERWLAGGGLTVTRTYPNHIIVDATGSTDRVEHLFHVHINDYRTRIHGRMVLFRSPDRAPLIDSDMRGAISGVLGLDSFPHFQMSGVTASHQAPPYFPQDFALAYDVTPLWTAGMQGQGQNIAVIGWTLPPSQRTLDSFVSRTGHPIATPSNGRLHVIPIVPAAAKYEAPDRGEIGMDIEATSGMAPAASINYYEIGVAGGWSPAESSLADALNAAGSDAHNNREISNSWGACEATVDQSFLTIAENIMLSNSLTGHHYFFSSGDSGSWCGIYDNRDGTGADPSPVFPSSSRYVVSVGGTSFLVGSHGEHQGETAWRYSGCTGACYGGPTGSGGGFSQVLERPYWQPSSLTGSSMRGYPDVAADADPATGAFVCYGATPTCGALGGTSLSAPLWAGMTALVDQYLSANGRRPVPFLPSVLYSLASSPQPYMPFHDILAGKNGGYTAQQGWDAVTGWGTPDLWNLARDMLATPILPPLVAPTPTPTPTVTATPTPAPTVTPFAGAPGYIYPYAGGGVGDGGPATMATIENADGLAFDRHDNLYVADPFHYRVLRITPRGYISTVAGYRWGQDNFQPDGALATHSTVLPLGLAVDTEGSVYVAESIVRKIDPAGRITTIAGNGLSGDLGDGGPARKASVDAVAVAVNKQGDIYISDRMHIRIRKVDHRTGIISTIAGTGDFGFSGDGGPATKARIGYPGDIALDSAGNLYIADTSNWRIRKVDRSGVITTVAGSGLCCGGPYDGGPATHASLDQPYGLALDSSDNLYISEIGHSRVRKVDHRTGIITSVAGNGVDSYRGDGGPASGAGLCGPYAVAVDSHNNIVIGDHCNYRIRKIDRQGVISTYAGDGDLSFSRDGGLAVNAAVECAAIARDSHGNLYIASPHQNVVHRVDARTGVITVVAGNGLDGDSGDGGPASKASLSVPHALTIDAHDVLYVTDSQTIRRVDLKTGIITRQSNDPVARLAVSPDGHLYFSTGVDQGVYWLDRFGVSHPVLPNMLAYFKDAEGMAFDSAGNLYVADAGKNRIDRITPSGQFAVVAGSGRAGYSGDGGPATAADLWSPEGVTLDSSGNMYIADYFNRVIRRVNKYGSVTTYAGGGPRVEPWHGIPAATSELDSPADVLFDPLGKLYIAEGTFPTVSQVQVIALGP